MRGCTLKRSRARRVAAHDSSMTLPTGSPGQPRKPTRKRSVVTVSFWPKQGATLAHALAFGGRSPRATGKSGHPSKARAGLSRVPLTITTLPCRHSHTFRSERRLPWPTDRQPERGIVSRRTIGKGAYEKETVGCSSAADSIRWRSTRAPRGCRCQRASPRWPAAAVLAVVYGAGNGCSPSHAARGLSCCSTRPAAAAASAAWSRAASRSRAALELSRRFARRTEA